MNGKAFAPEYQGRLQGLSVNTAYTDVLSAARSDEANALAENDSLRLAWARLAIAEACRRLGHLNDAEAAWRASYRSAKEVADQGAMAWALWSGGTLARQRGQLNLALRWLTSSRSLAEAAGDSTVFGYAFAGIAETLRIRGDFERARVLHEHVLAEARRRQETRHIVWALEGIAQIDRNTGDLDSAWRMFQEAADIAEAGGDHRGYAWALRGLADVLSLRGETSEALALLSRAERLCRRMNLCGALAYNRKMRGNVLARGSWYSEAARAYRDALEKFRELGEPRGEALAELGLLKSMAKLGRPNETTRTELTGLRDRLDANELRHTRKLVENALVELDEPASVYATA